MTETTYTAVAGDGTLKEFKAYEDSDGYLTPTRTAQMSEAPIHGERNVSSGVEVALVASSTEVNQPVRLLNAPHNGGEPVFISASGSAASGYPLYPGDTITLAVRDLASIILSTSATAKDVHWILVQG